VTSEILRPGDKAPNSGIYKTTHPRHHVGPQYVTAVFGDTFPRCVYCLNDVHFEMTVSAVHIHASPYFFNY